MNKNIGNLLAELIESIPARTISDMIDSAFRSFQLPGERVASHNEFNEHIALFIQHIYRDGFINPVNLDKNAALAEAISLLDLYYEGFGVIGYESAYLDVIDDTGKGFEFVVTKMAEIIKNIETQKWLNAYYLRNINPLDKNLHAEIIKSLFEQHPEYYPENILTIDPVCFCQHYRELLDIVVQSEGLIRHLFNSK
jgi:hypothetical protein